LEKVECLIEEEKWKRVLREWKKIDYIKREARLTVKSMEVTFIKLVLIEEEDDVA
jgi:hypothetical protein